MRDGFRQVGGNRELELETEDGQTRPGLLLSEEDVHDDDQGMIERESRNE